MCTCGASLKPVMLICASGSIFDTDSPADRQGSPHSRASAPRAPWDHLPKGEVGDDDYDFCGLVWDYFNDDDDDGRVRQSSKGECPRHGSSKLQAWNELAKLGGRIFLAPIWFGKNTLKPASIEVHAFNFCVIFLGDLRISYWASTIWSPVM